MCVCAWCVCGAWCVVRRGGLCGFWRVCGTCVVYCKACGYHAITCLVDYVHVHVHDGFECMCVCAWCVCGAWCVVRRGGLCGFWRVCGACVVYCKACGYHVITCLVVAIFWGHPWHGAVQRTAQVTAKLWFAHTAPKGWRASTCKQLRPTLGGQRRVSPRHVSVPEMSAV